MTMPHLMNCNHQGEGWCLKCVKSLHGESEHYRGLLEEIAKDSRKTRARRLAESGLRFWDVLVEEKSKADDEQP